MPSVADCLRQHGGAYLKTYGDAVPLGNAVADFRRVICRLCEPLAVRPRALHITHDWREMRIVAVVNENCRALVEHSVAYLDSG